MTVEIITEYPNPKHGDSYISTTSGMSGFFAVQMWFNAKEKDLPGGFWEPYDSGFGRYITREEAIQEAKQWAEEYNLPYME